MHCLGLSSQCSQNVVVQIKSLFFNIEAVAPKVPFPQNPGRIIVKKIQNSEVFFIHNQIKLLECLKDEIGKLQ